MNLLSLDCSFNKNITDEIIRHLPNLLKLKCSNRYIDYAFTIY